MILSWLGLFCMFYVTFLETQKIGRGRILTGPMRKIVLKMILNWLRKKDEKTVLPLNKIIMVAVITSYEGFRIGVQLLPMLIVWLCCIWTPFDPYIGTVYNTALIVLYGDDHFTADDDWLKRLKAVKNKIKWKMVLPAPARTGGTA